MPPADVAYRKLTWDLVSETEGGNGEEDNEKEEENEEEEIEQEEGIRPDGVVYIFTLISNIYRIFWNFRNEEASSHLTKVGANLFRFPGRQVE